MLLLAKFFDRCGMGGAYSETSMSWKLVQQHWRVVYKLDSKLLSDASRLSLVNPTFFGLKDELLLQDHMSVFPGSAAKLSRRIPSDESYIRHPSLALIPEDDWQ